MTKTKDLMEIIEETIDETARQIGATPYMRLVLGAALCSVALETLKTAQRIYTGTPKKRTTKCGASRRKPQPDRVQ